jgi:seryl-tRNA synthetase
VSAAHWIAVPRLAGASAHQAQAVDADLAFAHPAIAGVRAIDRERGRVAVALADGAAASADLDAQVAAAVTASLASFRLVAATETVWRRPAAVVDDALAAFVAANVITLGPGQYALRGPAARLRAALDARLARLAAEVDAEPWHLPSIESTSDLLRLTGYFSSHPQHVTWGFHLPPHFDELRRFARDARADGLAAPPADRAQPTGFILEPFVCHNVYRALRGARLPHGHAVTALGNSYRYEGHRFAPLERQWEFSMREAVLLGERDYVVATRARLIELTQALCDELDLDAALEVATDPFFAAEAASLRTFQAMRATKLELRLAIGGGATVAAASFNLHGGCFATPMDIRRGDDLAETACVGWGLERWMAAVVTRWGGDPAGWPAALRG